MPGKRTIVRRFTVEIQLSCGNQKGCYCHRKAFALVMPSLSRNILQRLCHTESHAHTGTHTLINLSKGRGPAEPC